MNRSSGNTPYRSSWLFNSTLAATTLSLLVPYAAPVAADSLEDSPKVVIDEAWQIVYREFVDGDFNQVNWQQVRQDLLEQDYSSREQAYEALRDALSQLNDPYTRFLDPRQFQRLASQTSGELSGVGVRLESDETGDRVRVAEVLKESPALEAGLQTGDRILQINGRSTKGMSPEDAARLLRGEVGSYVKVKIQRLSDQTQELTLRRERITIPSVATRLKREDDNRIGYIRIKEFSAHAPEETRQAIQKLEQEGAQAFVLDLRGNPGGLLNASIEIARMWLQSGTIVRTVDRSGESKISNANQQAITKLPLVVLVDNNSASASEILAGAIQDNERGVVVGEETFGKAFVQSVHSLSDGSGIAVTIAHYYTPDGTDISKKGIVPDIAVDISAAEKRQLDDNPSSLATSEDPYYQRAVSLLQKGQPSIANRQ
ncbi:S41 family peptidase [Geitlerinema sp. PCC 9228]|jgi:carboxyl-terminal processing protease|uniref:S41 family peptidase n=1 Tax=Geitlerinema sp. PCC 9228 TaxID=111611 RepID=UPI0008F98F44|nr:S41 family peptidase [Geitlerinema sp. PCC 9228]